MTPDTGRANYPISVARVFRKEKELSELKSHFVSMASHEFRTPLAAILTITETLSTYRTRMTELQIDDRLNKTQQQVMHMKDIMEDVLQLAQMQAGHMEYQPTSMDLDGLCREVIDTLENQAAHQGRIIYNGLHSPVILQIDLHLMRQVISNLLGNALKYSPIEKPVVLTLKANATEVTLTVQDQRIGIPANDFNHLFEPFHRASTVGTISGTGLELTIAKQAVELHGRAISVESYVGVGTVFRVTLPSQ